MNNKAFFLIVVAFLLLASCNSSKQPQENYEITLKTNEKRIRIGSETEICQAGVMQKQCMKVKWTKDQQNWEYFYDEIQGFTYEKGYEYDLVVQESKVANPAADASSIRYTLVKVVSKDKK